jgi:2-methylcitrate dehydratase PrpD
MSTPAVAEALARAVAHARGRRLPVAVRSTCESLLVDIAGLAVAARREDYVQAALRSWDARGHATALGHAAALDAAGAAFVNGTAAHGEDFDDTFEGGPVHAGVVIVPALLAAAERYGLAGPDVLLGIAVGCEVMCRGGLVAPKRIHKAGFHPTAVLGAMGAAAGVAAALRVDEATFASKASPARWREASSSISRRARGPSACTRGGRRSRACARSRWRARASPGRAPCGRAPMDCCTASPTPPRATGHGCSTGSASAG